MDDKDFPLPALAPHLRLNKAPDEKGEPVWTLHDPVANTYFKIDWTAFECLARFSAYKSAASLQEAVERETTLKLTLPQIEELVIFLDKNGLILLRDQKAKREEQKKLPLWKQLFHQYLYLAIPLFKPQPFLERTYRHLRWMHSSFFLKSMMTFLSVMVLSTLPRLDEFLHTFSALISPEGAIATLMVLFFVKVVHEFAHAYTAIRHGVKVPHMGVAFIVMYPVLYTETTDSWKLSTRRARFEIGMAGIMAELCLAAVFLALWHLSPAGSMLQSLSFLVVCVSLVSSLLINLNPLMRFDGYYMFSDATGFDNLQNRSCNFARHAIRKILFGLKEPPPEDISASDARFLTLFGAALLTYRFFLFVGIAILVYHIFFQPLGLILMMAELMWFIVLPVWREIQVWREKKDAILSSRQSLVPAALIACALLLIILPWKKTTTLPAVLHSGRHEVIHAPSPSQIMAVHVTGGQTVQEGDILAELDSPALDHDLKAAQQELDALEKLRWRGQHNPEFMQDNALSDAAIEKARLKVEAYKQQKDRLIIKAPFDGIIRDPNPELQEGRYIAPNNPLFTVVDPAIIAVTAYATEEARERIEQDNDASFISEQRRTHIKGLKVRKIADTGSDRIVWPELASVYGGPIPSDRDEEGEIAGRRSLYEIEAEVQSPALPQAERGYLHIEGERRSLFINWMNRLGAMLRREGKVG